MDLTRFASFEIDSDIQCDINAYNNNNNNTSLSNNSNSNSNSTTTEVSSNQSKESKINRFRTSTTTSSAASAVLTNRMVSLMEILFLFSSYNRSSMVLEPSFIFANGWGCNFILCSAIGPHIFCNCIISSVFMKIMDSARPMTIRMAATLGLNLSRSINPAPRHKTPITHIIPQYTT